MKTINDILNNYSEYETFLDDRFGARFCKFLTEEQMKQIGFELKDEAKETWKPVEYTEENVIEQLKKDLDFGWEKCQNQRGISSELMSYVVRSWCKVLENGLEDISYGYYGDNVFSTVAKHYGIELE